jgi:hypothetical protein
VIVYQRFPSQYVALVERPKATSPGNPFRALLYLASQLAEFSTQTAEICAARLTTVTGTIYSGQSKSEIFHSPDGKYAEMDGNGEYGFI